MDCGGYYFYEGSRIKNKVFLFLFTRMSGKYFVARNKVDFSNSANGKSSKKSNKYYRIANASYQLGMCRDLHPASPRHTKKNRLPFGDSLFLNRMLLITVLLNNKHFSSRSFFG